MLKNNNITETSYVRTEKIKKIIDIKTFFFWAKNIEIDQKKIEITPSVWVTGENIIVDANEGNNIDSKIKFRLFSLIYDLNEERIIKADRSQNVEFIKIYNWSDFFSSVKIVRYAPPIGLVKNVLKTRSSIFSLKDCWYKCPTVSAQSS